MRTRALALIAVTAAFAAACTPSKYAQYKSVSGDFTAYVPRGWNVIADADYDGFAQVNFIGPFDPNFYLGAPSLSVRWYKNYRPHTLRDGRIEMYVDADDFISQMLRQVYGDKSILYGYGNAQRVDGDGVPIEAREIIKKPVEITLAESGLKAKYFTVLSPTPARPGLKWGISRDDDGRPINIRMHEYAVVPIENGFYVLCYPATRSGYDKASTAFRSLIHTFHPYLAGPGGAKIRIPGRAR